MFAYLTFNVLWYEEEEYDLTKIKNGASVTIRVLYIIALIQAFTKGLSFLRIFDEFGFLVKMIGITLSELIPFINIFFVFTLYFGIAFMIMDIEIDTSVPDSSEPPQYSYDQMSNYKLSAPLRYPGINKTMAFLIYSFRNSIGDLATPSYDKYIVMRKEKDNEFDDIDEILAISLVWGIWLFQGIFMIIILLNYLVAVISQAYERVVNQR